LSESEITRRQLLVGGVLVGATCVAGAGTLHDGEPGAPPRTIKGAIPWSEGAADAPPTADGTDYRFFTAGEQAFIEPAIDRLIPPDETGPSASQANVHVFLDRQLAGAFGRGDHYYLGGPWPKGTPEQGYQSRLSPAQLYRAAIPAVEAYVRDLHAGNTFKEIGVAEQDGVLRALESGAAKLSGADGKSFFDMFLQNVLEGYFSDPIYGGNKDMAAWKMIGFPGAHYDYRAWVSRHGERVPYLTVGIKGRPGWSRG
jgi:gluconate 2-dehydrogenase gamma chain